MSKVTKALPYGEIRFIHKSSLLRFGIILQTTGVVIIPIGLCFALLDSVFRWCYTLYKIGKEISQ
jgi:hypothetical protein